MLNGFLSRFFRANAKNATPAPVLEAAPEFESIFVIDKKVDGTTETRHYHLPAKWFESRPEYMTDPGALNKIRQRIATGSFPQRVSTLEDIGARLNDWKMGSNCAPAVKIDGPEGYKLMRYDMGRPRSTDKDQVFTTLHVTPGGVVTRAEDQGMNFTGNDASIAIHLWDEIKKTPDNQIDLHTRMSEARFQIHAIDFHPETGLPCAVSGRAEYSVKDPHSYSRDTYNAPRKQRTLTLALKDLAPFLAVALWDKVQDMLPASHREHHAEYKLRFEHAGTGLTIEIPSIVLG